jgi:four helix bundle protein
LKDLHSSQLLVVSCWLLVEDLDSSQAFRRNILPKSFRDLEVWNKAIGLTTLVYDFTTAFPKHEIYGLTSQMRRAAVSIASNIAEGSARGTRADFRQFVKQAQGSNAELQTQVMISGRLGYADAQKLEQIEITCAQIGSMLAGLSNYLAQEVKSGRSRPSSNQPTNN